MTGLTANDLEAVTTVLGIRVFHIERKIDQHERKELNEPEPRRRSQIRKYAAEAEHLLSIIDKINGDA